MALICDGLAKTATEPAGGDVRTGLFVRFLVLSVKFQIFKARPPWRTPQAMRAGRDAIRTASAA